MEDFSTGVYVGFMIPDLPVNHAGALAGKRLLVDADTARTVQSLLLLCNNPSVDSDNKPKLETVPGKVNVKKTPSSATAFDVGIYTILQTEDHVCSSWPV
ncbi:hypothetical protein YC2023_042270 [Brassica napus]